MMTSHSHIDIEIRDSLQDKKLYHFKVLKLEAYEDRKKKNFETLEEIDESSKVTLMFSFVFPK